VQRLVVGHTPSGDCPAVVRDERDGAPFELVLADDAYGRVEPGSQVALTDATLEIAGLTELDDRARTPVRFALHRDDRDSPIRRRHPTTGALVKGQLADGDYLLFRAPPGFRVEQHRASPTSLR
jgi:hypothetical protein